MIRFQIVSKSFPNRFQIVSKSFPNRFQIVSKSFPNMYQQNIKVMYYKTERMRDFERSILQIITLMFDWLQAILTWIGGPLFRNNFAAMC